MVYVIKDTVDIYYFCKNWYDLAQVHLLFKLPPISLKQITEMLVVLKQRIFLGKGVQEKAFKTGNLPAKKGGLTAKERVDSSDERTGKSYINGNKKRRKSGAVVRDGQFTDRVVVLYSHYKKLQVFDNLKPVIVPCFRETSVKVRRKYDVVFLGFRHL